MFIWEPTCEVRWFEKRVKAEVFKSPGRYQLSQKGSKINIIADKTHSITIITIIPIGHVDLHLGYIDKKMKWVD